MEENPRPRTPAAIFLALLLFAIAIAAPFIGAIYAEQETGDSWRVLGHMVKWFFGGIAAAVGGIIFTIFGARRAPRSWLTGTAIIIAGMLGVVMLLMVANMSS
jgi:hypothetical protein